ncbi:uncharacterized protein LOC110091983 [Dendrobium catenatum]|uniref:DUF668 domain-containing protein n=1 Tax=Dendrobium catenatum TaxID=906689 RepID=A0A2I0VWV2_9ASPA|nr:uncharacterized protein LOC110091983 [Dendrobium catenatum]PKU67893.1 hypothetical protein MA16_Dca006928 [Dendrobium catenatum]
MVVEPWIQKMRKKKGGRDPLKHGEASASVIGILSFEVANAMSRAVHLHRSLSDGEISNLHHQILSAPALRSLISPHENHLLALAVAEKLDELNRVAAVTSRLGRRCSLPALQGFEHVYSDLLAGRIDPSALGFLSRDMDGTVRKMERFASSTAALYSELETLTELELSAKKFPPTPANEHTRKVFDQRIQWQRHDVKQLRDSSLWNQSYDKVVLLLARAVCTIHYRICQVFGDSILELENISANESQQLFGSIVVFRHLPLNSGLLRSDAGDNRSGKIQKSGQMVEPGVNLHRDGLRFNCRANPGKLFMECLSLSGPASWKDSNEHFEEHSCVSQSRTGSLVPFSGEQGCIRGSIGRPRFGPKVRLTMLAPSSTVGGSALALHYANIIIIIEKLLSYPHLIGEEAKDDLYQMLPASLKTALRKSLKYYVKDLAIYDASLAHDWKESIKKILSWMSPMAHKMIRWQAERNFEQQQIVLRKGVLLLQTLYFADREKTEAAICELLVGLNYICRYEQQQNALLDCTSSMDFDDGLDWQVQC